MMKIVKSFLFSEDVKNILTNTLLLVPILFFTWTLSYPFGQFVLWATHDRGGGFVDMTSLIGLPYSQIFFTFLFFAAFGRRLKYWWISISLIPATTLILLVASYTFWLPIVLGVMGWFFGRSSLRLNNYIKNRWIKNHPKIFYVVKLLITLIIVFAILLMLFTRIYVKDKNGIFVNAFPIFHMPVNVLFLMKTLF